MDGTLTTPNLTLQPSRFEQGLTTRQKPGLIGQMVHDVSSDGPVGLLQAPVAEPQIQRQAPQQGIVRFPAPPPRLSRLVSTGESGILCKANKKKNFRRKKR